MATKTDLVLLHGLLCDDRLWHPQVEGLANLANAVIPDLTLDDTVAAMATRVLAEAPAIFALAGLSMGGHVAFEIVRRAPERVERLALLSSTARPDTPEETSRRLVLMDLTREGKFNRVIRTLLLLLLPPSRQSDAALTGVVAAMAEAVGGVGFLRQQNAIMTRPDSRPGLADIRCPTLVLCGRDDALTPLELHEEMAEAIQGSVMAVIDDCGHISTLERPTAVTEVLCQWLKS